MVTLAGLLVYIWTTAMNKRQVLSGDMEFICFLTAYLLSGYSVFRRISDNLMRKIFLDGHVLLVIATVGAFGVSHYSEAVAVMLIFQVGNTMEMITTSRSKRQIRELVDMHSIMAHKVLVNGEEVLVEPSELREGDTVIVRPGERVPIDGVVVSGTTSVDTQMITGEAIPRDAEPGSRVYGGTLNLTGMIEVNVLHTYETSTVSKILNIVEHVEEKKTESERKSVRYVRNGVFFILVAAVAMVMIPYTFDKNYDCAAGIERSVAFLIAACPCAVGLSVSVTFLAGILAAAKKGIIVKGGVYLEALSKVNTFLFDKTGTLTEGVFEVQEVHPIGLTKEELLEIATYLESYSNHPIAISLKKAYGKELEINCLDELQEIPGYGLKAVYKGKTVYLGNAKLLKEQNIQFEEVHKAGSIIYMSVFGKYVGYIVISDTIKKDVKEVLKYLKKKCQAVLVMVTGDTQFTGKEVAEELEVDYYYASQLPEDKLQRLEEFMSMQDDSECLAAVGDGINDAPILAKADVGIAMGALGSDAAIEAADIVLMDDEPMALVDAIRISKETMKVIRQNLIYSVFMKVLVIALVLLRLATVRFAIIVEVCVMGICIINAAWASREPV